MNKPFFEIAAELSRPLGVKKPDLDPNYREDGDYFPEETLAKPDPDLSWHEIDDLGVPSWCLHVGYSVEWDEGNAQVWIHKAELNTGQRVIPLALNEIDQPALEAEIAEHEEAAASANAQHLAHRRGCDCSDCRAERADYEHDRRRDDKLTGDL